MGRINTDLVASYNNVDGGYRISSVVAMAIDWNSGGTVDLTKVKLVRDTGVEDSVDFVHILKDSSGVGHIYTGKFVGSSSVNYASIKINGVSYTFDTVKTVSGWIVVIALYKVSEVEEVNYV